MLIRLSSVSRRPHWLRTHATCAHVWRPRHGCRAPLGLQGPQRSAPAPAEAAGSPQNKYQLSAWAQVVLLCRSAGLPTSTSRIL